MNKSNEWIKLMGFYCPKCDSNDMQLYGANMWWNYKRQRWQIVDPKDAMFQCFNCDEQTPYEEATKKKQIHLPILKHLEGKGGCFRCKSPSDGFRDLCKVCTSIAELGGF